MINKFSVRDIVKYNKYVIMVDDQGGTQIVGNNNYFGCRYNNTCLYRTEWTHSEFFGGWEDDKYNAAKTLKTLHKIWIGCTIDKLKDGDRIFMSPKIYHQYDHSLATKNFFFLGLGISGMNLFKFRIAKIKDIIADFTLTRFFYWMFYSFCVLFCSILFGISFQIFIYFLKRITGY